MKKTEQDYINWLKENRASIKYISGYTNTKGKCLHICTVCGNEFYIRPNNVKSGQGCSKCAYKHNNDGKRLSEDDYINWLLMHTPTIKYVSGYINTKVDCLHHCNVCGCNFYKRPNNIKSGQRCPKCTRKHTNDNRLLTVDDYINWLFDNAPEITYLYGYTKTNAKCTHKCNNCGNVWKALPSSIKSGRGCPVCALPLRNKKLYMPLSKLEVWVQENNPTIQYIKGYRGNHNTCVFGCNVCGHKWEATPKNIMNNHGCSYCALHIRQSKGEKLIEQYLNNKEIRYAYPKVFGELRDKYPLRYDFHIKNKNILIEYQGIQHYNPIDYFGGKDQYKVQLYHDKLKRDYAKEHNYILIEIPYTVNTQEKVNKYLDKYLN